MNNKKTQITNKAFTLSEVLIALVIIGIIAAMTISSLLQSIYNSEYKTGYKKAYSDLSRAVLKSVAFGEFPEREEKYDNETTLEEWALIKKNFGVAKSCESNNAFDCWVDEERLCKGCADETSSGVPRESTKVFVDLSGRVWALYTTAENIFLIDINGDKKPNHFGKDRWIFTFANANGERICNDDPCTNPGVPAKIQPFYTKDITSYSSTWCQYPPCYYKSWLIN